MADSSFDVVSEFDHQELVNALDQVRREIGTRYDLKDSRSTLELGKDRRRSAGRCPTSTTPTPSKI